MREMNDQAGVVARRQLQQAGWSDADIRRAVRRRELSSVHRGVYVNHTGPPTWEQRAWAAVLFAWPAALCDVSALRAFHGGNPLDVPAAKGDIHIAIARHRTVVAPQGVIVHCRAGLDNLVAWHLHPPRLKYEEAVIDVAARQLRRLDSVAVLTDAVGTRRTTAARLSRAVEERGRIRRRSWLHDVLADIESGAWSVLEHGYLDHVERPHGLPTGLRQVRHVGGSGTQYRDVELPGLAIIELDGREHHSTVRDRDRDLDRDLETSSEAQITLRLGYGQIFERPCSTASKVGSVLNRRGWTGRVHSCGAQCAIPPPSTPKVPATW